MKDKMRPKTFADAMRRKSINMLAEHAAPGTVKSEFRGANPNVVLMAYMAFKQPKKLRMRHLIPKDREAWLEYLLKLIKKNTIFTYLTDREIRKVVIRARHNKVPKKHDPVHDPDLPACFDWTKEQVGQWVEDIGFPQFKEAFMINEITGKKLINVDASALNKMGLRYFDDIKAVTQKVRELLGIHRPNMLRAVMRKVPFEIYLKQRRFIGKTYDLLGFEEFCYMNHFPYEVIQNNKCALIEPTCEVIFQKAGTVFEHSSSEDDEEGSQYSLNNAPTVEFTVRQILIRNKIVNEIIESLIDCVFDDPYTRQYAREAPKKISEILYMGMEELGLDEDAYKERVEFARIIAEEMVKEVKRTAGVMKDIDEFRRYMDLGEDVTAEELLNLYDVTEDFLNEAAALAVLLCTGELDLENIFRQEPDFLDFVDEIVGEAEEKTNALVPPTQRFIDELISEAKLKILTKEFPDLNTDAIQSVKHLASRIIDKMFSGECDPMDPDSCVIDVYPEDIFEALYDMPNDMDLPIPDHLWTREQPPPRSTKSIYSRRFVVTPRRKSRRLPRPRHSKANTGSDKINQNQNASRSGEEESGGELADDENTGTTGEERQTTDFDTSTPETTTPGPNLKRGVSFRINKPEQPQQKGDDRRNTYNDLDESSSPTSLSQIAHGSSGEGSSHLGFDEKKKLSGLADILSSSDGVGTDTQHVAVAHAELELEYDHDNLPSSTTDGHGTGFEKKIPKKRGEFTVSTSSNPHSSSEDKKTAQNLLDEIKILKQSGSPQSLKESESEIGSKSKSGDHEINHHHRTSTDKHDSKVLLKDKLHRAEFAQRWAEREDQLAAGGASTAVSKARLDTTVADRQARLVRMTADQIVSDVLQMALNHLLFKAQSGQDSHNIMMALKRLQSPGAEGNEQEGADLTIPVCRVRSPEKPLISSLSRRDPRGTPATGLWGWPDDKLPPAPEVISHLRCQPPNVVFQQQGLPGQRQAQNAARNNQDEDEKCKDVICFYPMFQNWRTG